jgi:proteic killer suppression protein
VDVLFLTDRARREFSESSLLRRRWGDDGARMIALRLQQLHAAPTLEHLRPMPGGCRSLDGDATGSLAVTVHPPYHLVFRPASTGRGASRVRDWRDVESVTILQVVDGI